MKAGHSKLAVPTDIEGKVEVAKHLKDQGNDFFKEQKFKKAIINYSKAIAYTKGLPGRKAGLESMGQLAMNNSLEEKITDEMEEKVLNLECILKTNIATSYIKLENLDKAMQFIEEVLKIKPNAWKTLLRKGEINMLKGDYDKALKVLEISFEHAVDENAKNSVIKMKEKVIKLNKQAELKQKKAFTGIFNKAINKEGF